jgi:hypothetical protein
MSWPTSNAISKSSSAGKKIKRTDGVQTRTWKAPEEKVHTTGQQMNQFKKFNKGRISKEETDFWCFEAKGAEWSGTSGQLSGPVLVSILP